MRKLCLVMLSSCLTLLFLAGKCDKEDDPVDQSPKTTVFSVHPVKRAYYNPQFQRYITNQFTPVYKDFVYPFRIEQGKKYRFQMYGIDMSAADLYITNKGGFIISTGTMADIPEAGEYIVYEATATDTVHIFVRATDVSKVAQKQFYIAIEELDSYMLEWKGYRWLCDGDWAVNAEDEMVFKGNRTGYYKWIQLLDKNFTNYSTDYELHLPGNELKGFAGTVVTAANRMHHGYNLPEMGRYFRVRSPSEWNCMLIELGAGGGVTTGNGLVSRPFDYASLNIQSVVWSDSIAFLVEGKEAIKVANTTGEQQLYFVVEDVSGETIVLRDFILTE